MKIIINGISDKPCYKCDAKENTRLVNSPTELFNGTLCLTCIGKKTNAPVEKVTRKKKETTNV